MTDTGYYSATFKDGQMQIRARQHEDLTALRTKYAPELSEMIETMDADYPYRAFCTAEQWGVICARIGSNVRYDNFKSNVYATQGAQRAGVYGSIWTTLLELETPETDAKRKAYYKNRWTNKQQPVVSKLAPLELMRGDLTNDGEVEAVVGVKGTPDVKVYFTDGSEKMYRRSTKIDVLN